MNKNFDVGWIKRAKLAYPPFAYQQGSVLITVLLFAVVMTWLLLSNTETILLAVRMSHQWSDKLLTSEAAEAGLKSAEASIQHKNIILPASAVKIITSIKLVNEDKCHKKRYEISSSAEYHRTKVTLRSLYDYLPNPSSKCMKEKINQAVLWCDR